MKQCGCGRTYTEAQWKRLPLVGHTCFEATIREPEEHFEYRNCPCRSTLTMRVSPSHKGQCTLRGSRRDPGESASSASFLEVPVRRFKFPKLRGERQEVRRGYLILAEQWASHANALESHARDLLDSGMRKHDVAVRLSLQGAAQWRKRAARALKAAEQLPKPKPRKKRGQAPHKISRDACRCHRRPR